MKKLMSIVLAVAMCAAMSVNALASNQQAFSPYQELSEKQIEQLGNIAYMNLDGQSKAMQDRIIQARNAIIFNNSWVADDAIGYIKDENGNIIEYLPKFSDLFPEDWELPIVDCSNSDRDVVLQNGVVTHSSNINTFFDDDVLLKVPPTDTGSPAFCSLATTGFKGTTSEYNVTEVTTNGIYGNPSNSGTYNCGYTNKSTNQSYGYKLRIKNGQSMSIVPPKNITLAVHASTHDTPGYWLMQVQGRCVSVD